MQEHFKNSTQNYDLRKNLSKGVDVIKQIFYNVTKDYFSSNSELVSYSPILSQTAVNEMFSRHSDTTLLVLAENKLNIEQGIKHIRKYHPNLVGPFTDALIICLDSQTLESGRPPHDFEATIQNAIERGFFDESRGNPNPVEFLKTTEFLIQKYYLA